MQTVVVAFFLGLASTCTAGSIFIAPRTSTVQPNGSVSISVDVSGVASLFAFQFSLRFDPTIVQTLSVSEGSLFNQVGFSFSPGTIDNNAGRIAFVADSLSGSGPGLSADGSLATVVLRAIGAGTSAITISDVLLLDHNLDPIGVISADGSTTVTPEPSYSIIVASLLAVLAFRGFVSRGGHAGSLRAAALCAAANLAGRRLSPPDIGRISQ